MSFHFMLPIALLICFQLCQFRIRESKTCTFNNKKKQTVECKDLKISAFCSFLILF